MTPEQFQQVADFFPDAALLVTGDGRILAANRSVQKVGLDRGRVAGRRLHELAATPVAEIDRYLRQCRRSTAPLIGALSFRDAQVRCRCDGCLVSPAGQGREAQILLRLTPHESAIEQFVMLNKKVDRLTNEIHRRRIAEVELRRQRENLRTTLASIGDGVIVTDARGRVTLLNHVAESLTGWSAEEAAGMPLETVFQIVDEGTQAPAQNPVAEAVRRKAIVELANHSLLIHRNGRQRPVEDSAAPMIDAAGGILGVVLVFRDATERRRTEQTLRQRAEELVEIDRRKNEFLAMLGHELRNPLTPIRSGLDLLVLSGRDTEIVRLMKEQVDHLVRLVDDLLDMSRILRGKTDLRFEPVELKPVIDRAVQTVRASADERKHELTVSLPPEPLWLNADPVRLTQIVSNLLHNSIKYTDPGGRISVSAQRDRQAGPAGGDGVVVRIRDNGMGIEPAFLPYVFDLFAQADRTIDRSQGGMGIGLTLVRSLVELHDGTISAHSEGLGRGSEFVLRLPTRPPPQAPQPGGSRISLATSRRVLVVDDNRGAARMLQLLLRTCGAAEIEVAHDGPAGIDLAKQIQPEIILLDIGLPGMSGYEVAERLRREPQFQRALLVAVTGYGQDEDIQKSREAGFDEHLVKPPSLDRLAALFDHPKLSPL